MDEKRTISAGEAARLLGVSYPKAARWIYQRRLDATFIDGRWNVRRDSVQRLVKELARERAESERRSMSTAVA